jgi:hypothetical protein
MGRHLGHRLCVLILAAAASLSSTVACFRDNPCRDPTNDGLCYCPVGESCHHVCDVAVSNCTLGCEQKNQACSVSCVDNCTALCTGAARCDITCGERCSVSCEWIKERCAAEVGASSHINCEGAADCDVTCKGACDVACAQGHCRVRCASPADCEIDCGGGAGPASCPDGSRVCGRPC